MRAPSLHPLPPAVTFSFARLTTLADVPHALPVVHLAAAHLEGPANDNGRARLSFPHLRSLA